MMRNCLSIRYCGTKICLFLTYAICIWVFESNTKYFMPAVVSTEDVTTSSVRLIPYHSLLSSMFQPVSRRRGKGLFSNALNNIFPSKRYRRPTLRYSRPPSRYYNGIRRLRYGRPRPERIRQSTTSFNKFSKNYKRNRYPPRKEQNSFVPGESFDPHTSEPIVDEPGPLSFRLGPLNFRQYQYPNPLAIPVYDREIPCLLFCDL